MQQVLKDGKVVVRPLIAPNLKLSSERTKREHLTNLLRILQDQYRDSDQFDPNFDFTREIAKLSAVKAESEKLLEKKIERKEKAIDKTVRPVP